eukprot:NODE_4144_length_854_cov_26.821118_g3822_i0.p1 GENE.NODE_4144_length_854_cov_26.821118_g3822_i0~~NODE_4144_length_854_cov_26.821118_g3822_i0.p1  ORF type:complete len:139 (-),score=20.79 NODE_4144_length_854_cov_26.821118_g3822_i0:79-495(-)
MSKEELPSHLLKCPFEKCKAVLVDGQVDPIIKYFKRQLAERDHMIQDLKAQICQSFKEEQETHGLEEEQVKTFKDLVFSSAPAVRISAVFSERWPDSEWSVFVHHVSESDLSYVYDGFLQWVFKSRRYILVRLTKNDQ